MAVPDIDRFPPSGATRAPKGHATAVLVVDDHDLLRLGFRALVQTDATAKIDVLEAGSLEAALEVYGTHAERIGLVFLDLGLRDTQGLDGLATFRRAYPRARLVVLSGSMDESHAPRALAMGALAFLPKTADLREVVSFIRAAGLAAPAEVPQASTGAGDAGDGGRAGSLPATAYGQALTGRQAQILQWVLQGHSNKDIALLAQLSEGTVKNHVSTLLLLYGVRSRSQLLSVLL